MTVKNKGSILVMTMVFMLIIAILGLLSMKVAVIQNSDGLREINNTRVFYGAELAGSDFLRSCYYYAWPVADAVYDPADPPKWKGEYIGVFSFPNYYAYSYGSYYPYIDPLKFTYSKNENGFTPEKLFEKTGGAGNLKVWNIYKDKDVFDLFLSDKIRIDDKAPPVLVSMDVERDIDPKAEDGLFSIVDYENSGTNKAGENPPRYFRVTFTAHTDDVVGNRFQAAIVLNMLQTTNRIICLRSRRIVVS